MQGSRPHAHKASPGRPRSDTAQGQENSSYPAAIVRIVGSWLERAQSRRALRELAELDAGRLADIGLSREDALREASKPFWRQ